jgi:hypothetical protein
MTRDEPPPIHCQLCKAFMGENPEPELSAPSLGGSDLSKSVDQVQAASENIYKLSDMQDGLRPGDQARKVVSNPVSQFMDKSGFNPWGGAGLGITPQGALQSAQSPDNAKGIRAIQSNRFPTGESRT